ncbi:MAG TPA: hypothetical protein PKW33_10460 [Anaerolineaceae bacterium]|nr:hypothetical protein [Anaerolineaceae bacterium]
MMFLKLVSIEWTRMSRRAMTWISLAVCAFYSGLVIWDYYLNNKRIELMDGTAAAPGLSFDLATALDQMLLLIPLLILLTSLLMGSDYANRTNQHWLMRAPRFMSLLARFTTLALFTLLAELVVMISGGLTGFWCKVMVLRIPDVINVNWFQMLAAPFYMTLVNLPYIAMLIVIAVVVRSTFFSIVLGLGYNFFLEYLLTAIFHGAGWTKWLITNVYFSVSFLLNGIGDRSVATPGHILTPGPALITSAVYTMVFLALAVWIYRRQDVGG